ncbi:hypothetical protein [Clostridium felsineum]|uniref:Uncharacterized protein n=1 Tax=Clostridium felsineum TaxID=36839 RepID=A0A1S8LII0_9CLOT|nr:hypothetical protein [Clostridium felsineum]MCR3760035.1 hypothetical protein [Clostridium felsineum]URZ04527.1 hypothetical protein CLAUR_046160 [Clostridium felsineum]URZ09319.1 hypothetical protein CLROS_047350 [Clostridium felsineum]URZ14005.1 hypothetical protein CROST_047830 [Clostridium felsineum]URZ18754.1 hypothetical protein CLFE_048420 [Clostridium felsineum DSM 794]
MADTTLLSKISYCLCECCEKKNISKISELTVTVNSKCDINSINLTDYLKINNPDLILDNVKINVEIDDLPDQTVIMRRLEGELNGN